MENQDLEHSNSTSCKNCGHPVGKTSLYCPECGQKNSPVLITAPQLFLDMLTSLFNIDNKFFRTLGTLFVPGKLSRLYLSGKLNSFSHPLRFYLLTTFILFGFIGYQTDKSFRESSIFNRLDTKQLLMKKQKLQKLDSLANQIQIHSINRDYRNGAQGLLYLYADLNLDSLAGDTINSDFTNFSIGPKIDSLKLQQGEDSLLLNYVHENEDFLTLSKLRRESVDKQLSDDSLSLGMGIFTKSVEEEKILFSIQDILELQPKEIFVQYGISGFWEKLYLRQLIKIFKDPGNAILYVLSGFSWVALLFIPLMAICLKILYFRQNRFYIEHLIFTIHNTNFLFILMILYLFLQYLTNWAGFAAIILIFPFYLLFAHRYFYKQNWFSTLVKTIIGNVLGIMLMLSAFLLSILVRMLLF